MGTTHFIADEADPLWKYTDTGMHRRCFLAWEQRQAFIAKYTQSLEIEVGFRTGAVPRRLPLAVSTVSSSVPV